MNLKNCFNNVVNCLSNSLQNVNANITIGTQVAAAATNMKSAQNNFNRFNRQNE